MVYEASSTCWQFHEADDFIRGLMGPIGSGKSVACCAELMKLAHAQQIDPNHDNKRRTQFAVIRNTYRELQDTTIRTWHDWFPQNLGEWRPSDMEHRIKVGELDATFAFRALDRPDDIKKLLSWELTAAWVNEAREVPKAVIDMLQGRVGRFPSMRDGGPTWSGIIMDTNPPDTDHWWYKVFEEEQPEGWRLFKQPSAMADDAENLENLIPNYYSRLMNGKDQAWIDVYVHGKYGYVKDGKPVYPEYVQSVHDLREHPSLLRRPGRPYTIYMGADYGLTPAAVFAQKTAAGQYQILSEVVTEDMGAVRFGKLCAQHLRENYPGCELRAFGDPAGDDRSQVDERTPMQVMRAAGVPIIGAPTNDPVLRREAVVANLTQLTMTGQPGLVISPRCPTLRKAMAGGYKFRRMQVVGEERYADRPDKNMYSHVAEALQYLMVGAGESRQIITPTSGLRTFKSRPAIRPRRVARG